jgi:hypothetical protein
MSNPRVKVELESRISLQVTMADESIGSRIVGETLMHSSTGEPIVKVGTEIGREVALRKVVEVPLYRASVGLE